MSSVSKTNNFKREFPLYHQLVKKVEEEKFQYEPLTMAFQLNQLGNQGISQYNTMQIIKFIIFYYAESENITLDPSKLPYGGVSCKGGSGSMYKTPKNSNQKNVLPPKLCNIIGMYLKCNFFEKKE
jgi:hypothetical protein